MASSQSNVWIQFQYAEIFKVGKNYLCFLAYCPKGEIWCFSKSSYFDGEMNGERCCMTANYVIRERSIFLHGSKSVCNFSLFFTVISLVEKGHAYLRSIVSSAAWGALTYFLR